MITALDHFVLICPDIESATDDYTALLGAEPEVCHVRHNPSAMTCCTEGRACMSA